MPADPQRVLNLAMDPGNDAEARTVREYLVKLLAELWREEANFSGKKPFGNSDWQWEVYVPLVKAGLVGGLLDEDGYLEDCDTGKADELILAAIAGLGAP